MKEYQIKNREGVIVGRFSTKLDRDDAFKKYVKYGFVCEEDV